MNTIIFIDDEEIVRETYQVAMQLVFGAHFEIICLDVESNLQEMMKVLDGIENKVTYFIDEKLKHTGKATYSGLDLVEKIRMVDSKIPIYILTSAADDVDKYHGDIEFVIDKNDWSVDEEDENFSKRFIRHINTYRDIKSSQAKRFDELFEKSLFSTLSVEERKEFESLNVIRSKKLIDEAIISEESLEEIRLASDELSEIYAELCKDENE